ncbi:SDR family NAD(P)-dependent oxidoreductase [Shewanella donghaensis]|uniref:SDR family NAD(P)-dependent oxidoreductase n=1 Tax=Shewanella donghaensis TaxID=238836 RepID=UPI001D03DE1A|nr:SDR family NAD(P)-dependent oxidoreductase [Shewanella donghaensis]
MSELNSIQSNVGSSALIIGASSGIATALLAKITDKAAIGESDITQIITVSQSSETIEYPIVDVGNDSDVGSGNNPISYQHFKSDYSVSSIADICQQLTPYKGAFSRIFICNGRLHNIQNQQQTEAIDNPSINTSMTFAPEKRLEDFDPIAMQALFESNTITPMLWLQHLVKLANGKQPCIINILSARVGSISDNRLGGWYSYRASKAALNMLIKTTAIEYARRAKNVKLIAFHPGTTDTALSKPFQANVPSGKLFSTEFVASQLLNINKAIKEMDNDKHRDEQADLDSISFDGQASFIDWQGKQISW